MFRSGETLTNGTNDAPTAFTTHNHYKSKELVVDEDLVIVELDAHGECEDDADIDACGSSNSSLGTTIRKSQRLHEFKERSDNSSYRLVELYNVKLQQSNSQSQTVQHDGVKMNSKATQTSTVCCQQCGSKKTLVCINCTDENACSGSSSAEVDNSVDSSSSNDMNDPPPNSAALLLKAIKRTAKMPKSEKQALLLPCFNDITAQWFSQHQRDSDSVSANDALLGTECSYALQSNHSNIEYDFGTRAASSRTADVDKAEILYKREDITDKEVGGNFDLPMYRSLLDKIERKEEQPKEETFISSTKIGSDIKRFTGASKCAFCPHRDEKDDNSLHGWRPPGLKATDWRAPGWRAPGWRAPGWRPPGFVSVETDVRATTKGRQQEKEQNKQIVRKGYPNNNQLCYGDDNDDFGSQSQF